MFTRNKKAKLEKKDANDKRLTQEFLASARGSVVYSQTYMPLIFSFLDVTGWREYLVETSGPKACTMKVKYYSHREVCKLWRDFGYLGSSMSPIYRIAEVSRMWKDQSVETRLRRIVSLEEWRPPILVHLSCVCSTRGFCDHCWNCLYFTTNTQKMRYRELLRPGHSFPEQTEAFRETDERKWLHDCNVSNVREFYGIRTESFRLVRSMDTACMPLLRRLVFCWSPDGYQMDFSWPASTVDTAFMKLVNFQKFVNLTELCMRVARTDGGYGNHETMQPFAIQDSVSNLPHLRKLAIVNKEFQATEDANCLTGSLLDAIAKGSKELRTFVLGFKPLTHSNPVTSHSDLPLQPPPVIWDRLSQFRNLHSLVLSCNGGQFSRTLMVDPDGPIVICNYDPRNARRHSCTDNDEVNTHLASFITPYLEGSAAIDLPNLTRLELERLSRGCAGWLLNSLSQRTAENVGFLRLLSLEDRETAVRSVLFTEVIGFDGIGKGMRRMKNVKVLSIEHMRFYGSVESSYSPDHAKKPLTKHLTEKKTCYTFLGHRDSGISHYNFIVSTGRHRWRSGLPYDPVIVLCGQHDMKVVGTCMDSIPCSDTDIDRWSEEMLFMAIKEMPELRELRFIRNSFALQKNIPRVNVLPFYFFRALDGLPLHRFVWDQGPEYPSWNGRNEDDRFDTKPRSVIDLECGKPPRYNLPDLQCFTFRDAFAPPSLTEAEEALRAFMPETKRNFCRDMSWNGMSYVPKHPFPCTMDCTKPPNFTTGVPKVNVFERDFRFNCTEQADGNLYVDQLMWCHRCGRDRASEFYV